MNDSFDLLTPASACRKERRAARFYGDVMGDLYGLLSMSSDWRNPLMWAHYGDRHRGLCIGFDVDPERFREIKYVQARPTAATFGKSAFLDLETDPLQDLSHMKFEQWAYEKEYRTFISKRDNCDQLGVYSQCFEGGKGHFQEFRYWLKPKEIILGERWAKNDGHSRDYRDLADALCSLGSSVSVFKVRSSFHKFRMVKAEDWKLPARVRKALGI